MRRFRLTKFFPKTQLEPGQRPMFTRQELIRLIIPLMIEQLLAITIGMADSVMVASCGEAAVSGVSLVDSINVLLINILSALTTGGAIVASQYLGRQDVEEANIATKQLFMSTLALSAAIMAVCLMFRTLILYGIFGHVDPSVMQNCEIYFFWSALSYPFLGIYNSGAAIYRSMGNSKISMFTSVIMNLWNVCGNAILIFGFSMGVAGAALATFTSRILGAVLIVLLLHIQHNPIRLDSLQGFAPKWGMVKSILKIGVPTGLENGMFQVGKILVQGLVASFGTASIAANAVSGAIAGLPLIPGSATGLAMVTVVGQCMGAGEIKQAKNYTKKLMLLACGSMGVICILMMIFLNPILGIYQLSADTMGIARVLLLSNLSCVIVFWGISFVLPNALRAAGDVRFTMTVSMLSMWLCRVAASYLLAQFFQLGVLGVWIAMYLDWVVRDVFFTARFLSGKWTTKKVV